LIFVAYFFIFKIYRIKSNKQNIYKKIIMGCGCKKNKSQTTVPTVNVNQVQLQNETQQSSNDTQIVDMIMEKLKTVEEEQNNEQSQ